MPPPANNSAATATAVTTFPYSYVQTDVSDSIVYYEAWYKITAPTDAKMISVWGRSGNIYTGPGYIVQATAYSDAGITQYAGIESRINLPIQIHVTTPSQEFWIAFRHVIGAMAGLPTDTLTIGIEIHDPSTITEGDFLVNNDVGGLNFPTAIFSHTVDNVVNDYWTEVTSAGEGGDILPSGIFALNDFTTSTVRLYAADRTIIATTPVIASHVDIRRDSTATELWLRYKTSPFGNAFVQTLSSAGVLGTAIELVGASVGQAFCVDSTNNIVYITGGYGEAISRWDLDTSTLLSDFAPTITNYEGYDLLVLADGTVAVIYLDISVLDTHLVHYDTSGSILNDFNFGLSDTTPPRLAWAFDNPNSVWIMDHVGGVISFENVRLNDGNVLTTRLDSQYDRGQYEGPYVASPILFGQANSCPFFLITGDAVPEDGDGDGDGDGEDEEPLPDDGSGIYYISGTSIFSGPDGAPIPITGSHDNYYDRHVPPSASGSVSRKIPNPTIKTALFGE